jgi:pyruvate,water dikinase
MASTVVRPLRDFGIGDRLLAGGKGASLGELIQAGFPVPDGYVVTAPACTEPPAVVDAAIAAGYRALGGPPVAVRSSATAEDGAGASFAGTAESYLGVRGADAVAAHVRKCWASLYRPELVSYRQHRGLPEAGLAMAVLVQRMVDARCSGVMFTRSPASGDRSVIAIEAAWGLGSAVVGGAVTPDSFLVSKVTGGIVRRQVAVKTRQQTGPGCWPPKSRRAGSASRA